MKLFIVLFFLLLLITSLRFFTSSHSQNKFREGQNITLEHTFLDEPKTTTTKQYFSVNNLTIYTNRFPELHYGDSVTIKGRAEFNSHGQLVIKNAQVSQRKTQTSYLLAPFSYIRQHISNTFQTYLSRQDAGLLLGIVFGIKSGLDSRFHKELQVTGVLHVVAASGMNVSMVGGVLLVLFRYIMSMRKALLITILGVSLYVVLSGMQASLVRAGIMASLAFSAQLFGRKYSGLYGLFVAACIMLLIDPILLFDIGFQLSFSATLGILLLKPVIDALPIVDYLTKRVFIFEDFSTTLSAQLLTLPFFFITFSSYTPMSILVNVLVLWTIPFLMILGSIAAVVSFIHPLLSLPFLYLSLPFLWFFNGVIGTFSEISPEITLKNIPILAIFGYYLMLLAIVLRAKRTNTEH